MTEGDAPDAAHDDAPLVVPPGVPLRVWDWLLLPIMAVVCVSLLASLLPPSPLKAYLAASGVLVVAAAVVQGVNGYRLYVGWSEADILRYRRSVTVTVAALGIFCLFSLYGAFAFAGLGYRLAEDPAESLQHVRASLSERAWKRLTVTAVIVAVVAMVARPLASALGGVIGVTAVFVWVVASIAAGFAYRSRPEGHRFF